MARLAYRAHERTPRAFNVLVVQLRPESNKPLNLEARILYVPNLITPSFQTIHIFYHQDIFDLKL